MDGPDDRLEATLLGTALGDALGLPCEGMSARAIARRFGPVDRFRLLGRAGFVSDDTEQSALMAQSLARHPRDVEACVRDFRRALLGWFCRLPWGVGLATVKACLRIAAGVSPSGVMSAGNGAAMRSAIVGVFHRDRPDERRAFARALAEVTHRDPRAVEGAVFVAEVAALAARPGLARPAPDLLREARGVVEDAQLGRAIDEGLAMAASDHATLDAAGACGTSGFVVHTLAFASFAFARFGDDPMRALTETISAGGDTDSIAAIVGAWSGARSGAAWLPTELIGRIHDGPFGPGHLKGLARSLRAADDGAPADPPRYSAAAAMGRNLALYPVVLAHGFRRLAPF
ncbi:ADP-ribosylglycohydrolase family protein [Paludisphaera sp.]|uniref:ADP-ribosylglycohydrolase family protein n=1 Tax=Paludisphaera sp. TaxID=2017432 RepID=UPI00301E29A8